MRLENLIIDTRVYVDHGCRDVSILWSSITQEHQLGEVFCNIFLLHAAIFNMTLDVWVFVAAPGSSPPPGSTWSEKLRTLCLQGALAFYFWSITAGQMARHVGMQHFMADMHYAIRIWRSVNGLSVLSPSAGKEQANTHHQQGEKDDPTAPDVCFPPIILLSLRTREGFISGLVFVLVKIKQRSRNKKQVEVKTGLSSSSKWLTLMTSGQA